MIAPAIAAFVILAAVAALHFAWALLLGPCFALLTSGYLR
jgi:hypothetical protein